MLKVADLQQLVNGLAQPMRSAGASQKVLDDLARLSQGLEPFKERTMGEFNEFLEKADQCVRTGEWPAPGRRSSRRSGEPRQPGMSVEAAAQRIASLMERAADQNMDMAAIETEVRAMQGMTMPQLKEAAEQAHLAARGRTKDDLLKALAVAIKERKMSSERGQRPMEAAAGASAEHRHEHHTHHGHGQHPVGAAGPGNA